MIGGIIHLTSAFYFTLVDDWYHLLKNRHGRRLVGPGLLYLIFTPVDMLPSIRLVWQRLLRVFKIKTRNVVVWNDLLSVFRNSQYRYAVQEREEVVAAYFSIDDDTQYHFLYGIADDALHMRVEILNGFDIELTGEMMILAGHFNNRILPGFVEVNAEDGTVTFLFREPLMQYLFLVRRIDDDIIRHYIIARDVLWAFKELQQTREDPVFVFSELVRKRQAEDNQGESAGN